MTVTLRGEDQLALETRILKGTTYMGVPTLKLPFDAWVYQELIHELHPDWIVEVGNHRGGSLLYLAHLCDLIGHGQVVGVDWERNEFAPAAAEHPRVRLVTGDALTVLPDVREIVGRSALVIEDSAHTYDHTLAVARGYGQLVPAGGYLVIEDSVMLDVARAVEAFLIEDEAFEADASREWPITWNPGGYLRRRA